MKRLVAAPVAAIVAVVAVVAVVAGCSKTQPHAYTALDTSGGSGSPAPLSTLADDPHLDLPVAPSIAGILPEAPRPELCLVSATVPDTTLGFAFDSAAISKAGEDKLRAFATQTLAKNTRFTLTSVTATGFSSTDAPGRAAYDQALSQRRARAVADVVEGAFSGVRVRAIGVGQAHPRAPNDTEAHRAENRRTVLTFHFDCKNT